MRIAQVAKLPVFERLLYWIRERESIRLKKEAGQPKPWTDDEILQRYKFCNVRRMDDKVSQWLLKNWYEPHKDHPNMVLACTLARQLNNNDSLGAVGFPVKWEPKRVQGVLEQRAAKGLKNYSAAYMITANYGKRGREKETKAYQTVFRVCQPIHESGIKPATDSMEKTWSSLLGFQGFSSFISGQVVADLRWAVRGEWKDKGRWAALGPGSERGLSRLAMGELNRVIVHLKLAVPRTIATRLEAIDYQNCLCEFDKYERVLWNQGRPKQLYSGV